MELRAEDNIIEIKPDIAFANKLIKEELQRNKMYHRLHPSIKDAFADFILGEIVVDESMLPFKFFGGNDKNLVYSGNITVLYNELVDTIRRNQQYIQSLTVQSIDNLLFATLFSWGEYSERRGTESKLSYLDQLIELYANIKKNQVRLGDDALNYLDDQNTEFDTLPTPLKEKLIDNNIAEVEGWNIGGLKDKLIYIPSHMDIIIANETDGKGIVIPHRLSKEVYKLILREIVKEHERNDTKFYKKLCDEDISIKEMENRSPFRHESKNIQLLNRLIIMMDNWLVESNQFRIAKRSRQVLIYDILKSLHYIADKHKHSTREQKDSYIKTIIRDNKPEALAKSRGEQQLFR